MRTLFLLTLLTTLGASYVMAQEPAYKTAMFGAGCFWCIEPPFDKTAGVIKTTVGYSGGHIENPTYQQVSSGTSGHKEVIEVTYDPQQVSYDALLDIFWQNIDPLDAHGQFCDKGEQYQSAIYYQDENQHEAALASKKALEASGKFTQEIATQILPGKVFYPAEDYHQDYYTKNPVRYKFYRWNCGRDQRLQTLWGEK